VKKRINLPLLAIVGEGLFSRLSFGLIGFTLPLYARHLGLSLSQVGILAGLNSAVAVVLKPAIGWMADRFGLKRTFVAAISLRSVVSLLLGFATAPWELYAIRTVHGLSMSLRDPAANSLIAEHGDENAVASAFAWYQTARAVANSVSKALAGILLTITAANYPVVFFIAFALSVLPLLVVVLFVKEHREKPTPSAAQAARGRVQPTKLPSDGPSPRRRIAIFPFVGLGFLIASSAEMLSSLFPVIATEYAGLSKGQAGFIYMISTLVIIFAAPVFGWLSDNVSRKLVLLIRSVANMLSSIVYLMAPGFLGIGLAKTVDDMGTAAFRPAWGALMAQVANLDKSTRARTVSWMGMGEDAGGVLAPILAGFLWSTWGITALMGTRFLLAVVTEVYTFAVVRPPAGPRQVSPASANEQTLDLAGAE